MITEAQKKELKVMADMLHQAAEYVEASLIEKRGQKATAKRARSILTEIKKEITPIKKILMEA